MKLDATDLRYLSTEEFRVLTAVEMGSKNHEVVPNPLIAQISGLRSGGVNKILGTLAKRNLVAKVQNTKYEGYRLTYGGYDYLAMRALSKRESLYSVGNQIGVGKESDIYAVADEEGNQMVLKLHRLGRISFRAIKSKRDYMGKRKSASWMYMSRLAAQKEWAFMKVLYEHDFPVPKPIDQARHCILMEIIDAYPLRQVAEVESPGRLYSELMDIIVRFARAGLIHGDFNEFNILIRRQTGAPVIIDFPQMVSTSHENAEWYFNRDVECIRRFFRRRFQYESSFYPRFKKTITEDCEEHFQLDVMVSASGFSKKDMKVLEDYMETVKEGENEGEEGEHEEELEENARLGVVLERGEEEEEEDEEDEEEEDEEEEDEDENEGEGESSENSKGEVERNEDGKSQGEEEPPDIAQLTAQLSQQRLTPSGDAGLSTISVLKEAENKDMEEGEAQRLGRKARKSDKLEQLKDIVTAEVTKERSRQKYKYNSKRSTRKVGRPKGSKAKQDVKAKIDANTGWD